MKKNFTVLILFFLTSISSYSQVHDSIQMTGNDRDEHGCIGSAGQTWSVLKNECIRIWEVGLPFTNYGTNTDEMFGATVIISADKKKAEAFLPPKYAEKAVILDAVKPSKAGTNKILYENKAAKLKIYSLNKLLIISINDQAIFMNNGAKNRDKNINQIKKKK